MAENNQVDVHDNHGIRTVQINGECLEYEATTMYVIHNKKASVMGYTEVLDIMAILTCDL